MVWRKYLDEMIDKYNSSIKNVSFRSKRNGWKLYSLVIEFDNGEIYVGKIGEDPYLRSFIMDIHLRESCYDCNAKGIDRPADITVADFWGIDKVCEGMNDDKGVSAVIDKDFASAVMARDLDADYLIILTAVEKVMINFRKPDERALDSITVDVARRYMEEGHFAPGSMLPKVQAAVDFASSKPGRKALITLLEKAKEGIAGKTGTMITM